MEPNSERNEGVDGKQVIEIKKPKPILRNTKSTKSLVDAETKIKIKKTPIVRSRSSPHVRSPGQLNSSSSLSTPKSDHKVVNPIIAYQSRSQGHIRPVSHGHGQLRSAKSIGPEDLTKNKSENLKSISRLTKDKFPEYRRKPLSRRNPCICCICLRLTERSSMLLAALLNISTTIYVSVHICLDLKPKSQTRIPPELNITALFSLTLETLAAILLFTAIKICETQPHLAKIFLKVWLGVTILTFVILIAHFSIFNARSNKMGKMDKSYISSVSLWWIFNLWFLYLSFIFSRWIDLEILHPPPSTPEADPSQELTLPPSFNFINTSAEWSYKVGNLYRRAIPGAPSSTPGQNSVESLQVDNKKEKKGKKNPPVTSK